MTSPAARTNAPTRKGTSMSDLSTTIVEGYHYTGDDLDLSGTDFWGFALDQRAFGPRQLVVVTARRDGAVVGLAHCEQTELPELALKCCLAALDDGAAAAVAYSDEPVSADPPIGLRDRLDRARVAARAVRRSPCGLDHVR